MARKKKDNKCKCGCGRKRGKRYRLSETCKTRRYRERNPIGNAYNQLKNGAKKRKKTFTISLEYFTRLVIESGYIEGKGLKADSLTIDRIKNEIGYEEGNLQVITRSENSKKFHTLDAARLKEEGIHIDTETTEHPF